MVKLVHWSYFDFRFTFPRSWGLTAVSAWSTPPTRFLSTRLAKPPPSLKEREDMMPSKEVSEDRPSPSSERRPRPQRRLLSSSSAPFAREEDSTPLSVARHSFLERRKRLAVVPSTEQLAWHPCTPINSLINVQSNHNLFFLLLINSLIYNLPSSCIRNKVSLKHSHFLKLKDYCDFIKY